MITRNFNLCLNAGVGSAPYINVNQYDSGEQWVFSLFDESGAPFTPTTGAIVGIKSDGLGIINTGTVVDGKVVINETMQMTASPGKAVFELLIDSETHGTANFIVMVEPRPGDNASLSESDISLYQSLLDIAPSNTGTVGQVLTRTADGAEWASGGGGAVDSVNGQTGVVVLTASDVGAMPDTYTAPVTSVNGATGAVTIANATTTTAGLMSATDKSNLDTLVADYSSALQALGVI